MDTQEYIDSGILELYVYGLLDESENADIAQMARKHKAIDDEIISIEKAIVNLSTSFSPFLSSENFARIKAQLGLKHAKVVRIDQRRRTSYVGWAAAVMLLLGLAYQYTQLHDSNMRLVNAENEKSKIQEALMTTDIRQKQTEDMLAVTRDIRNTVVAMQGQAVSPASYAKVYYNTQTAKIMVDAAGLPEPPEGKVYQVWALKLNPLTPVSIGLLDNFKGDPYKMFNVDDFRGAEGFGITLEPAGGSKTPTMDQLYTMGKV